MSHTGKPFFFNSEKNKNENKNTRRPEVYINKYLIPKDMLTKSVQNMHPLTRLVIIFAALSYLSTHELTSPFLTQSYPLLNQSTRTHLSKKKGKQKYKYKLENKQKGKAKVPITLAISTPYFYTKQNYKK